MLYLMAIVITFAAILFYTLVVLMELAPILTVSLATVLLVYTPVWAAVIMLLLVLYIFLGPD